MGLQKLLKGFGFLIPIRNECPNPWSGGKSHPRSSFLLKTKRDTSCRARGWQPRSGNAQGHPQLQASLGCHLGVTALVSEQPSFIFGPLTPRWTLITEVGPVKANGSSEGSGAEAL